MSTIEPHQVEAAAFAIWREFAGANDANADMRWRTKVKPAVKKAFRREARAALAAAASSTNNEPSPETP